MPRHIPSGLIVASVSLSMMVLQAPAQTDTAPPAPSATQPGAVATQPSDAPAPPDEAAAPSPAQPGPPRQYSLAEMIDLARKALNKGEFNDAEYYANSVLTMDPNNALAKFYRARALTQTNRAKESVSLFEDYIHSTEGQNDWEGYYYLGMEMLRSGYRWQARRHLGKAEELRPVEPRIKRSLADCEMSLRNLKEGLEFAQRAYELDPSSVDILTTLGRAQQLNAKPQEAIETLTKAMEILKTRLGSEVDQQATILGEMDQLAQMQLQIAEQWVVAAADNSSAYLTYARVMQEGMAIQQSIRLLQTLNILQVGIKSVQPPPPTLLFETAKIQLELKHYLDAKETLRQLLQIDPNNAAAKQWFDQLQQATSSMEEERTTGG